MEWFDVTNPFGYLSWREDEIANEIIDFVDANKHYSISHYSVDEFLDDIGVDYHMLPQYLKNKIDELDVF